MARRRRIAVAALVVVVAAVAAWGLAEHAGSSGKEKKGGGPEYYVSKVSKPTPFSLNGRIESKQVSTLGLPAGKVQEVRVQNGQSVHKGDVILTTWDSEKQESRDEIQQDLDKARRTQQSALSSLNAARQQLAGASSDDEGYRDLQNQVREAQSSYDDATSEVTADQTKLNSVSGRINNVLTAPYDGIVSVDDSKHDAPSITLYSSEKKAVASVSEYDYSKLSTGRKVEVRSLATGHVQESTVAFLSQVPSGSKGSGYPLSIDVDAVSFMDGQTVRILVPQDSIRLPKESVRKGSVWLVDGRGRVRRQHVDGRISDGYFHVEDGVRAGQRIVMNPDGRLKDGRKVE